MLKRQTRGKSSAGVVYACLRRFQPELRCVYVGIADQRQASRVFQCEGAVIGHHNIVM